MSLLKRMMYMGLGAFLVLALVVGGVAVFAQSGDGEDTEAQDDAQTEDDAGEAESAMPGVRVWRFREGRGALGGDGQELLAEALGISVEELQAAHEELRAAVIEQALDEGLITEAQAEQLLEGNHPFALRRGLQALDVEPDELLAGALGISVEELQDARDEARAAQLEALVDSGALTQEQADLLAAREAVQGYVDQDALAATIQNAYEEAIGAALEDGVITQEQADQLLENLPTFGPFGFGRGHHGRGHGPGGGVFMPGAPAIDTSLGA